MNEMIASAVLAVSLALGIVPLALTRRFQAQLDTLMKAPQGNATAPVAAIIPCKGIDQGFQENITAFLTQDYPALQLIFVVATEDDPALHEISKLLAQQSRAAPRNTRTSVHVAGIDNRRAQKLTNQLHGIAQVGKETEFLVFLDSDIRPDPGFIGRLVAPLQLRGVGATTGFRWYHPPRPTLGSMLRSTWNAGALPLLTNPRTIFAFGGAMAIRRATFDQAGIAQAWERALSDDFPFTLGVRRLGLETRFVPSCIAVSYESSTLAETIEFTNRQSIISRVYFPPLWWGAAIAHSLSNVFVLMGLLGLTAWLVKGGTPNLLLAGCLALIPLQCLNAVLMLDTVPNLLPGLASKLGRLRLHYVLCAPLASILSTLNTFYSLTTRQIIWRGIRYELISPTETRVI